MKNLGKKGIMSVAILTSLALFSGVKVESNIISGNKQEKKLKADFNVEQNSENKKV